MRNMKIQRIMAILLAAFVISPFMINYVSAAENLISSGTADAKEEFEISENGALKGYNGTSESLVIPEGVVSIDDFVFSDHTEIKYVIFPKSLKSIGNYSFSGCSYLQSILLSENVEKIGSFCFANCVAAKEIYLNSELYFIGELAFWGCSSLEAIYVDQENEKFASDEGILFDKNLENLLLCPACLKEEYYMPDNVVNIGVYAFFGCDKIESIKFSKNLKTIGDMAFYRCSSLKRLEFYDGLRSIGSCAFGDCTELGSVILPKDLMSIGSNAFFNCGKMTDIKIYSKELYIGRHAFYYCKDLTIHGIKNSTAQKFALKNGIKFKILKPNGQYI